MLTMSRIRFNLELTVTKSFLSTMRIFKGVPEEALRDIEKRMVEKKYQRQETISLEGDPAECVWFVKEGHVKAIAHIASGRCQTLCMVGPSGMFGACCSFGGGKYPCHIVAETDVTVVTLPMVDFMVLLAKYPQIGLALIGEISERLRLSKHTQTYDQEVVEKRILHALLKLVAEFGNTIPLTRREVAEVVGTTVETSIRTFSRLENDGLVTSSRGQITVKNVKDLARRLEAS